MNRTFKIVGRYLPVEEQKSWCRGKPNTQAKKRVYASEEDFLKYSPETIERWKKMYSVEIYEMVNGKWKTYE